METPQNPQDQADIFEQTINENQQLKNRNTEISTALASSNAYDSMEQNSIHERLETDKILERIEHFLKGDKIIFTEDGSYYGSPTKKVLTTVKKDTGTEIKFYFQEFVKKKKGTEHIEEVLVKIKNKDGLETDISIEDSKILLNKIKNKKLKDDGYEYIEIVDESKKPFNEYGVSELMRIMSMYITKETILSCYKEERIMEILGDLGNILSDFFYANYEKMGMDTKYKESKFQLIVINLLHAVESCYRRAIGGSENKNLNIKGIVTQNDSMNMPSAMPNMGRAKWNPLKPSTW